LQTALPASGQAATTADGIVVAAVTTDRYLLIMSAAQAEKITVELQPMQPLATTENAWHLAEIRAGLARIQATTRDQFQPQELNYPAVGGVSYTKGCYTGQEIVARLYFRGKLKQRLYRLSADAQPSAETGIYSARNMWAMW
jgi:folate-binding protein YgfZ